MSRDGPVAAVVLAAGRASRFGSTKQLATIGGRPLLRIVVESILDAAIDEVVVVLGHDAERVAATLDGTEVRRVHNERHADGLASSLAAGVGSLAEGTAAALVALGDQPLPHGVVNGLVAAWRAGDRPIVVPVYQGVIGNPVLFDASLFDRLVRLDGDRGARRLIEESPGLVALVRFGFPAPPDIDTPEELGALDL